MALEYWYRAGRGEKEWLKLQLKNLQRCMLRITPEKIRRYDCPGLSGGVIFGPHSTYHLIPNETIVEFTKRLNDLNISEKLFDALDGKGVFRRFKNVLRRYPEIEEQWYKYKNESEV